MRSATVLAPAKINLSLDVLERRSDGYHNLMSVMQTVSLTDIISIIIGTPGIKVSTNISYLSDNKQNIAHKAAALFYEAANISPQVCIEIHKQIPIGAGLGGGSADAAAVLRVLNQIYENPLKPATLSRIGLMCGADVPFCLEGGTSLAEGLGEILTPLTPLPNCGILIVKPAFSIRTKDVFSRLDLSKIKVRPDTHGILSALKQKDLENTAVRMFNVLEPFLGRHHNIISDIKNKMLDLGARGSVMSGSGSSVFGIFASYAEAMTISEHFKASFESVFVAEPLTSQNFLA